MKTYFRLLSYAKPLGKFAWPYVVFTLLSIVFGTLNLALLAPLLTVLFNGGQAKPTQSSDGWTNIFDTLGNYALKSIEDNGPLRTLQIVCLVIIFSVSLSNIFRYLSERTMESLRMHTLMNLREALFNNVMNLHMGFFSSQRKGDILSKMSNDVQVVQYTVTGTLQVLFKEPVTLIAYLVMLFSISVKLTLFSLLIIPLSGLIIARIVKNLKKDATASHESFGTLISLLDEALQGMRIVKAFNAVPFITDRFSKENRRYTGIVKKMIKRQQLASPVSETLGVMLVAGIVLFGGSMILSGDTGLSGPTFIAYIALFSQIMRPAKAISNSFTQIHSGLSAGERVLELIDEKPLISNTPNALAIEQFKRAIELKNVSFSYGDAPVLHQINIEINKGETIALVGPSGGGKSTLMDLIPRFMDPTDGAILIDGIDIRDCEIESLRALMGVVSQESILFNDTIFNNIAFGKEGSTAEEVEKAAKIANAHDFIVQTVNGYQTNIGDRGVKLSGGQRQRICIARAILHNPPIMLLDEATSALDTASEKIVQESLENLMKNRTSVVIAHRLSTIKNASRIVVIDRGEIVEAGTHDNLMNQNGLYRRLVEMQSFTKSEETLL